MRGAWWLCLWIGAPLLAQPSLDAVKEFQVLSSNFTAEYGRASGGVVNTILKSGTNAFHGSVFDYMRTKSLAANNYFTRTNPANPPGFRPDFKQQQPGASGLLEWRRVARSGRATHTPSISTMAHSASGTPWRRITSSTVVPGATSRSTLWLARAAAGR